MPVTLQLESYEIPVARIVEDVFHTMLDMEMRAIIYLTKYTLRDNLVLA